MDQWEAYFNNLRQHRRNVTNKIVAAITSTDVTFRLSGPSQLNDLTEHFFDNCENWTSVKLFCDDVVRLLRQLYGDIDPNLLWYISHNLEFIVAYSENENEDEDLYWWVHSDAMQIALGVHIPIEEGLPRFQGLPAVSENLQIVSEKSKQIAREKWKPYLSIEAEYAIERNNMFAREVLGNPSNFSKYTVKFATIWRGSNLPYIWP